MFLLNKLDGLIVRYFRSRLCRQRLVRTLYSDDFIYSLLGKQKRKHVWIVAAPKSGSTWLSLTLENVLKWKSNYLVPDYDRREQEVDVRQLVTCDRYADLLSIHQHCRFSAYTIDMVKRAGIKVVLTTRNIFDTVYSITDHLSKESTIGSAAFMTAEAWSRLVEEDRLRFVVRMILPWYFNFYAGWFTYMKTPEAQNIIKISRYEDLRNDPVNQIRGIIEFAGVCDVTDSCIESALSCVDDKNTRKNVGVSGRGGNLPFSLVDEIRDMAGFYPEIDFTSIGISQKPQVIP